MTLKRTLAAAGIPLLLAAALTASAQPVTILHNFTSTPDGANPMRLVWTNNLFYGNTANGGTNGNGSLFTFNPANGTFKTTYSFTNAVNSGTVPNNLLVTATAIYGTTQVGSTNGHGMVFAANTNGTSIVPLYSFGASPDGQMPEASLILSGTTLYGTTISGGNGPVGTSGTIFKINTNGTGYVVLHSFTNTPDGYQPESELVMGAGNRLYGTASAGGANSKGCIFAINTDGSNYTNLYSFTNIPDANFPNGGLVLSAGMLYGTGQSGGSNNSGAIFAINTNGTGYKVLHHFTGFGGPDGVIPKATMSLAGGTLYGTTTSSGANGGGTLFLINTNGSGFTVIQNFTSANPLGGALRMSNSVWGTTYQGGPSAAGTLYRLPMPAIISQPQSLEVPNNTPASFTVTAADDSQISYAWYFNTNTLLLGQTTNVLTLANATNNNAGAYTVVVSDSSGSVTSSPAVLIVDVTGTKPTITQNPQNFTVTNGLVATFTNAATGTDPLFYQWYYNTNTLVSSGVNNTVLTLSPATTNQAGYYMTIVTNAFGSATSAPALLTVIVPAGGGSKPVISQQPQNYTVTNGYDATFTNVATGTGPLFYQWYFNTNTLVNGATNPILLLTSVITNQAGKYTVVVSNSVGSVTSSPALLTVISTKPIIFIQPQSQTVTNGDPFTFTVVAGGQPPLRYQWYTNTVVLGHRLTGQTNSSVSFGSATNWRATTYIVVITNVLGTVTSDPATLTILTKPVMTLQPQSVAVSLGDPVTFTADATGAGVLKFQWYFKTNTLIVGATNPSLTFPSTSNTLAGFYDVRVTNTFGAVTSSFALLSFSSRPQILSFSVNSSGSALFTFSNLPSSTNRLWASTNLVSTNFWKFVASNVMNASGTWLYTETNSAKTNAARFFRISSP